MFQLFCQLFLVILMLSTVCLCLDDCQINHNISDAELDAIPKNASIDDMPPKIRCYAKCLLEPYLDDDGKIDPKRLGNNPRGHDSSMMLRCKKKYDNVVDAAGCDYSVYILQCLILK